MYIEEPYDESSSDLISLSTQDWKILDSTMNLVNIEMGADGDANVVTNCRDNNADCAGMVSMGYCDDYPV